MTRATFLAADRIERMRWARLDPISEWSCVEAAPHCRGWHAYLCGRTTYALLAAVRATETTPGLAPRGSWVEWARMELAMARACRLGRDWETLP